MPLDPELTVKIYDADSLPTASIKALEIFSTGKWNGDSYDEADLDAMVSAFNQVGFEPPIKAGHADGQENEKEARRVFGSPALGYVERIYRQGSKLLADFKDVPRRFADLIKAGTYRRVSAEIYWKYSHDNKIFPRVLKAVAFLGADIPALTNLKAIESLFQKNEAGSLFAYDENKNEFRAYEHDYDMMGMGTGRKLDKKTVRYQENGDGEDTCGNCRYYQGQNCSVVEGTVDYSGTCDMQKPMPGMKPKEMSDDDDKDVTAYELDGQIVEAKNHFIRKKGSQWCVLSHEGKTLGCHDTREKAVAQLGAVEASKARAKENSRKEAGGNMTEEEVSALIKKREEELEQKMFKQFEDRIHKAREEGKEEATKENELLREDIRKLQLEKRSERIEHWIKQMKDGGKLLPAEETKVRSLRHWIPDEGPELKYFAVKEGKTQEFTAGPAEMFESLFEKRPSIFKTLSQDDGEPEEAGQELADPGAELDRRAKAYVEKRAKDNVKVTYREAVAHVMAANPHLAQRYS